MGINNFKLPLLNVRNAAQLTVYLYNGEPDPSDPAVNLVGEFDWDTSTQGLEIPAGVDSKVDNYFEMSTEQNFTTVLIEAAAGTFKVGQFSLTEFVEGQPINISVGVTGIDSDDLGQSGDDSVEGSIDITVRAANDNVVDASGDTLEGTEAEDIFVWQLADATGEVDVVTDFRSQGNDILDLRDILQLEDSGAPGEIGNLENFLNITLQSGGLPDTVDTVIEVSSHGDFGNGVDQTIMLEGIDLVAGNGDLQGIIQNMLDTGMLITD